MKKEKISMKVKVLNDFRNPLDNTMAKKGMEMNVPKSQFWFKRMECKDVELVKSKVKNKVSSSNKNNKSNK